LFDGIGSQAGTESDVTSTPADGPPGLDVRRNWIDRALVLDNTDAFRNFVRSNRSGGVARNGFAAQMIPSAASFGGVGPSGMGAYHGKAGFDAFSHYRSVVGSELPFSITGGAAPPFRKPMKIYADTILRLARNRTRRRLRVGHVTRDEGEQR
jgi:coniferyl-aldehyde dehydrogenase